MKIIIAPLFLCFALPSFAQHHKRNMEMPLITHSIGASFQKFDMLNGRIAGLPQYEQLKTHTATLGLGWLKQNKQLVSSGSVNLGSSMSGDRDKKSSTIRYAAINADIGYDLLKSDKVMLYPFAGLGLQKYQAIFYKDNSAVAFNDVLQSPVVQNNISSVRFNNGFAVYRLGIGLSFKSPKYPSHSVGLQAGYTGSFKKQSWKSNENQQLSGAPQDKVSQFFVGLVFASKPMFMK